MPASNVGAMRWRTDLEGRGATPTAALAALMALQFSDLAEVITITPDRQWDATGIPLPNPDWIARASAVADGNLTLTP